MAVNDVKGKNVFDRTIKGDPGSGALLRREGTDKNPFDPGLFARVTDVSWGIHGTITGQFFCVGYSHSSADFAAMIDTDADNSEATIQYGKRGWITSAGKIFIHADGQTRDTAFQLAMRIPLFGVPHALIALGSYLTPFGLGTRNKGLVAVSIDNGATWTDLRFPAPADTYDYNVRFGAYNPTTRTLYAEQTRSSVVNGDVYATLYKFTPGASPSTAGTWTLMKTDTYDSVARPETLGYPYMPTDIVPAGSYIVNDVGYWDLEANGYKYFGVARAAFGMYLGKVTFFGPDGAEHTLDQSGLDGVSIPVDDARFNSLNWYTGGNGLIVATTHRNFDPPDDNNPDGGQEVVIASADLGATWELVSDYTKTTADWFFICASFGKNKL